MQISQVATSGRHAAADVRLDAGDLERILRQHYEEHGVTIGSRLYLLATCSNVLVDTGAVFIHIEGTAL